MKKLFKQLAVCTALALTAPSSIVSAQSVPSYAQPTTEEHIVGRVIAYGGAYELTIRDERGFHDRIRLHKGTIITPTGLTLASGMTISIIGHNAGPYFAANEIDTPYSFYEGVPYFANQPWYSYDLDTEPSFFFHYPGNYPSRNVPRERPRPAHRHEEAPARDHFEDEQNWHDDQTWDDQQNWQNHSTNQTRRDGPPSDLRSERRNTPDRSP